MMKRALTACASFVMTLGLTAGCSSAPADIAADDGENVASTSDALVAKGTWVKGPTTGASAMPVNAVLAGTQGSDKLYVCRGKFGTGLHPGKTIYRGTVWYCNFGRWGRETGVTDFEVLTLPAQNRAWVSGNSSVSYTIPANAIYGGFHDDGSELGVCRAKHTDGSLHPGRLLSSKFCRYGYGGEEKSASTFEVLTFVTPPPPPPPPPPDESPGPGWTPCGGGPTPETAEWCAPSFFCCTDHCVPKAKPWGCDRR